VRPSSVGRTLLALARLVGFGAALCAFVLWVVPFIGEARVLEQDFGITPATLVQAVIMAALALGAAWASLRTASLILVMISVVSFVPVGFYALLLSGYDTWIGVSNLLCLAAGVLMAVCDRIAGAERRSAVG
jgi:hypothetical protein